MKFGKKTIDNAPAEIKSASPLERARYVAAAASAEMDKQDIKPNYGLWGRLSNKAMHLDAGRGTCGVCSNIMGWALSGARLAGERNSFAIAVADRDLALNVYDPLNCNHGTFAVTLKNARGELETVVFDNWASVAIGEASNRDRLRNQNYGQFTENNLYNGMPLSRWVQIMRARGYTSIGTGGEPSAWYPTLAQALADEAVKVGKSDAATDLERKVIDKVDELLRLRKTNPAAYAGIVARMERHPNYPLNARVLPQLRLLTSPDAYTRLATASQEELIGAVNNYIKQLGAVDKASDCSQLEEVLDRLYGFGVNTDQARQELLHEAQYYVTAYAAAGERIHVVIKAIEPPFGQDTVGWEVKVGTHMQLRITKHLERDNDTREVSVSGVSGLYLVRDFGGVDKQWHANGLPRQVEYYSRVWQPPANSHVLNGPRRRWFAVGWPELECNYVDGELDGRQRYFEFEGDDYWLRTETFFKAGVQQVHEQNWAPDGTLSHLISFMDGKRDGLEIYYQPDGAVTHTDWRGGKKHGLERKYLSGGQLASEMQFEDGQPIKETRFHPDGQTPRTIQEWRPGQGLIRDETYAANGDLQMVRTYEEWREKGGAQLTRLVWYENGKITSTKETRRNTVSQEWRDGDGQLTKTYTKNRQEGENDWHYVEKFYQNGEVIRTKEGVVE